MNLKSLTHPFRTTMSNNQTEAQALQAIKAQRYITECEQRAERATRISEARAKLKTPFLFLAAIAVAAHLIVTLLS